MIHYKADGMFYQGKPLMELTIDELRAAVVEAYNLWLQSRDTMDKILEIIYRERANDSRKLGRR